jgi:signal transduction histidine kinase
VTLGDAAVGTLVLTLVAIGLSLLRWGRAHGGLTSRPEEGRDQELGMRTVHLDRMTAMVEGSAATKDSLEASLQALTRVNESLAGRIDETKRLQRAVLTAERRERPGAEAPGADLGRFVAGIAHEVRDPLFGILANLDAWEDEAGPGMSEFGARIRREAQRLQRFTNDLLDYGGPVPMRRERVSLPAVWRGIEPGIRSAALRTGVRLETPHGAEGPYVTGDERRLGQALGHVMTNAIQHTPAGGTVSLRVAEDARYADCVVADTGDGFDAAALASAFEPFSMRRQRGTGLGLAIVKRFVEDMGGSVAVSNRPGGGAEVRLRFSRKLEEPRP